MTDLRIIENDKNFVIIKTNNHIVLFSYESKIIELKKNIINDSYELEYFNDSTFVQTYSTFKHVIRFMKKYGYIGYNYKNLNEMWKSKKRDFN